MRRLIAVGLGTGPLLLAGTGPAHLRYTDDKRKVVQYKLDVPAAARDAAPTGTGKPGYWHR